MKCILLGCRLSSSRKCVFNIVPMLAATCAPHLAMPCRTWPCCASQILRRFVSTGQVHQRLRLIAFAPVLVATFSHVKNHSFLELAERVTASHHIRPMPIRHHAEPVESTWKRPSHHDGKTRSFPRFAFSPKALQTCSRVSILATQVER